MAKHKIFKYSGLWYHRCGHCPVTYWAKGWRTTFDLLTLHVEHRHRELLTTPPA